MLRIVCILFPLIVSSIAAKCQRNEAKFLLDSTMAIMKKYAANRKMVDWKKIEASVHQKAEGISDPYKLAPAIEHLFKSINDFHGTFFYRDSSFRWNKPQPAASDSILAEWKKGPRIKSQLISGVYGYLRIPSMPARSIDEFSKKAQALNDSLCKLLVINPKGMIVDLRLNGGGAMHPMILGVQNLLGDGKFGEFIVEGKEKWILRNSSFYVDTAKLATITPGCSIKADKLPVVVIIGPQTGSSGEFLLMTFKGRPKTVLLGNTTAGYVTVNNGYQITDTAFLNLSIGYGADRNGKIYSEAMKPDIVLDGRDSFNDVEADIKVQAAIKWLKEH